MSDYTTFSRIPASEDSFLTGIRRADSDFMLQQAQMQGLEGMMMGNQKAGMENQLFRSTMPNKIAQSDLEGSQARTLNQPSFLQDYLAGNKGIHQSQAAKGKFDSSTVDSRIGAENTMNRNRETEELGHTLSMIAASNGPEVANQLYMQVMNGLPPEQRRNYPPSYDPKTWKQFQDASFATPSHRRELGKIDQTAAHANGRQMIDDAAEMDRLRVREEGADRRTRMYTDATRYTADSRDTPVKESSQQAISRLRRTLAQNPDDEEAAAEYQSHLDEQWEKKTERDPSLTVLRLRAITSDKPEVQEKALQKFEELRNDFYSRSGIYMNAPPKGTVRMFSDGPRAFIGGFRRDPSDPKNWKKQ